MFQQPGSTPPWLTAWLAGVSDNPYTKNTYRRCVGILCRWLMAEGILESDASKGVILPRAPGSLSSKLITEAQVDVLLQGAKESVTPYLADVIITTYDLALRLSEVCAQRRDWYDSAPALLKIPNSEGFVPKNGLGTVKPVSSRVRVILDRAWLLEEDPESHVITNSAGQPLEPKHTSKQFKKQVRRCGFPETMTFHGLRHGGITRALVGGASLESVRRFANHSKIEMTMRYVHLLPEQYHADTLEAINSGPFEG